MENFIPADGKSIGFIRALQFAVPVPPIQVPPAVETSAGEKSACNKWVIGILVVVIAAGVIVYFFMKGGQEKKPEQNLKLPGSPNPEESDNQPPPSQQDNFLV